MSKRTIRRSIGVAAAIAVAGAVVSPVTASADTRAATAKPHTDFNGDGYADVAVGSPTEAIGGVYGAGQVTVLRGGASGLTGAGAVAFNQNTAGVPGTAEQNDFLGRSTALIDTDQDGRAELYVGAPGENVFDGAVWAFRNPGTGPVATGSVSFGAGTLGTVADRAGLGSGFAR